MKSLYKFVSLSMAITLVILPLSARAQGEYIAPVIKAVGEAANFSATLAVPTSNVKIDAKETNLNIFGISLPFGMDTLAIVVVKKVIERMVDSTVEWINTGRDGGPVFVTDLEQYSKDLADGIAGEFIEGSDLNFLCSPFQANIRASLRSNYVKTPAFQCTISDVVENLDAFLDDFDQGGWEGWFAMTQNSGNNPYGAYLAAQVELDSQIARKLGVQQKLLDWGEGFLSTSECLKRDAETGECTLPGPVRTPGTVVNQQLQEVLGTGLNQLELADEFDELINALLGKLLEKAVFSTAGLISGSKEKVSGGGGPVGGGGSGGGGGGTGGGTGTSTASVICSPTILTARINESVTWLAQSTLTNPDYRWAGDGILVASGPTISVVYDTPGEKSASVTVFGQTSSGQSISTSAACQGSVIVNTQDSGFDNPRLQ